MKVITKAPGKTLPTEEATTNGIAPTATIGETYPAEKPSFLEDYAQLFKYRVMIMVVLCGWAGYSFAARKSGQPYFSMSLLMTLLGIALTKCGAAAINEALEVESDAR